MPSRLTESWVIPMEEGRPSGSWSHTPLCLTWYLGHMETLHWRGLRWGKKTHMTSLGLRKGTPEASKELSLVTGDLRRRLSSAIMQANVK